MASCRWPIYYPAPSAMQSALVQKAQWVVEFEPCGRREIEPLLGWVSSRDPFASISRLRFPDLQSAVDFAERHGWRCLVRNPLRCIRPKSGDPHDDFSRRRTALNRLSMMAPAASAARAA